MQAVGIDMSHQPSSVLDEADIAWAYVVVTVCGHAGARCPVLPTGTQKVHCPFDDPARVGGGPARESRTPSPRRETRDARRHACSRGTTA